MSQSDVLIVGMKGLGVEIGESSKTQLPRSRAAVTGPVC